MCSECNGTGTVWEYPYEGYPGFPVQCECVDRLEAAEACHPLPMYPDGYPY